MIYKINDISVAANSKSTVTFSDLDREDGTGRTEDGTAFRDSIRKEIRQIDYEFDMLKQSQVKVILECVRSDFFNVDYEDPELGRTTKVFYAGDRTVELLHKLNTTYWKISGTFIEQ